MEELCLFAELDPRWPDDGDPLAGHAEELGRPPDLVSDEDGALGHGVGDDAAKIFHNLLVLKEKALVT